MAKMMKVLIEQNKAMTEMMINQSKKKKMKFQVLPTWLKDQLKYSNKVRK